MDAPGENQSRLALLFTFRKNWLPPEFGEPVFAIDLGPARARKTAG